MHLDNRAPVLNRSFAQHVVRFTHMEVGEGYALSLFELLNGDVRGITWELSSSIVVDEMNMSPFTEDHDTAMRILLKRCPVGTAPPECGPNTMNAEVFAPRHAAPTIRYRVDLVREDTRERNDCTVRAIAVAGKLPWSYVNDRLIKAGIRRPRKGASLSRAVDHITRFAPGVTARVVLGGESGLEAWYNKRARVSLNRFLAAHPKGRFVVAYYGHAFAIVDGVVYDNVSIGKSRRIYCAYEIILNDQP